MNRKRKAAIKSITAFLISISLLFPSGTAFAMNGIENGNEMTEEVMAVTVSENESAEGKEPEAKEKPETEDTFIEASVSGQALPEVQTGAVSGPANPVHHCTKKDDGTDYTVFAYIYFGSYPQSEVTDSATIAAIDKAIKEGGAAIEADSGKDVVINGIKYRRISRMDTTNSFYFDDMPNNGYRYFKWERMKWKVLKNDGSTLFVVAAKAFDCKEYNEKKGDVTWENSTIRKWLEECFYATAFSHEEQKAIIAQNVMNNDSIESGTGGGNVTNDKIYLLSVEEVLKEEYGFCSDMDVYSLGRMAKSSDYANARGCYMGRGEEEMDNCRWWLRSPSIGREYSGYQMYVSGRGDIWDYGSIVNNDNNGVCPALHINLSSSLWMKADGGDENSVEEKKKPEEPKQTEEIKITKLTLTGPSTKLAAGKTVPLSLQAFPENAANKAVSFQSSNSKYATVEKTGKVSIKKAGAGKTVTITATALDGSQVKASYKFKIMKHAVKKITLKAPGKTLKTGKSVTVKANVKTTGKSVNRSLKWTSSNGNYATVNSKGKVTAKKAGKGKTVTITAAATDGSGKKGKVKIKIK